MALFENNATQVSYKLHNNIDIVIGLHFVEIKSVNIILGSAINELFMSV